MAVKKIRFVGKSVIISENYAVGRGGHFLKLTDSILLE